MYFCASDALLWDLIVTCVRSVSCVGVSSCVVLHKTRGRRVLLCHLPLMPNPASYTIPGMQILDRCGISCYRFHRGRSTNKVDDCSVNTGWCARHRSITLRAATTGSCSTRAQHERARAAATSHQTVDAAARLITSNIGKQ